MIYWKKIKIGIIVLGVILVYFILASFLNLPCFISNENLNIAIGIIALMIVFLFFIAELLVIKPIKEKLTNLHEITDQIINATNKMIETCELSSSSSEIVSQEVIKVSKASDKQSNIWKSGTYFGTYNRNREKSYRRYPAG